jgi:hypothetical protein
MPGIQPVFAQILPVSAPIGVETAAAPVRAAAPARQATADSSLAVTKCQQDQATRINDSMAIDRRISNGQSAVLGGGVLGFATLVCAGYGAPFAMCALLGGIAGAIVLVGALLWLSGALQKNSLDRRPWPSCPQPANPHAITPAFVAPPAPSVAVGVRAGA